MPLRAVAWLWFVCFLATPYTRFYDEIILFIPVLALFGHNGDRVVAHDAALALYLLFLSLLVSSWTPLGVSILPLPLLVITWLLWRRAQPLLLPVERGAVARIAN